MKAIKKIFIILLVSVFLSGCIVSRNSMKQQNFNENQLIQLDQDISVIIDNYIYLQHVLVSEKKSEDEKQENIKLFSIDVKNFCKKYNKDIYISIGASYFSFAHDIILNILSGISTQNQEAYLEGIMYYYTYVTNPKYLEYVLRHEQVTKETFNKDMEELWTQFKQEWLNYLEK